MRHTPPPARYRIYERDRRLVVIDSWAQGGPERTAKTPAMPQHQQRLAGLLGKVNRLSFDGRTSLTTHPLFDAKGPRTIILPPGGTSTLTGLKMIFAVAVAVMVFIAVSFPWLLVPLLWLGNRKTREQVRAGITRWLDRISIDGM